MNKMTAHTIRWMLGGLLLSTAGCQILSPLKEGEKEVHFKVTNPEGASIKHAVVSARFRYMSHKPYGRRSMHIEGTTNWRGRLTLSGKTHGRVDYEISAPNYYNAERRTAFREEFLSEDVVLRPKKNPIPMFALKDVRTPVPVQGKEVGFDLFKADWMPPYGEGEHADLMITAEGQSQKKEEQEPLYWSTMHIRFTGENNGMQVMQNPPLDSRSVLRSDYEAPETGYQPLAVFEDTEGVPTKTDYKYAATRYIRIRSPKTNGNAGGLYGKIYGNMLQMAENGPVLIISHIFINPEAGSRNIEFDPARNLAADHQPAVAAESLFVELP